ncbi:hypothetical protein BGZ61DRAFT_487807 [Ilyonectria robusta]|uniref:uncharacterized protein n=1 Tax=Ilyonectria robusta TaxID=1079257 RepID=UPI001E8E5388|nr:uncharacterized protein BGZ61DRAFT_487807 [Ilyonectria robusta]KAH8650682.1 hypothetical protein BGZ61DRAFT_487807 [Ilyonectria robusta]
MADNLVKIFKKRGFEVQKGIPKLPGITEGSVISLGLTIPEKSPTAPKPASEIVPVVPSGGIEEMEMIFGRTSSSPRPSRHSEGIGRGAVSFLMEGVRDIRASPSPPPKSPAVSQIERDIRSPSPRQLAGLDVSMRDIHGMSARSDVLIRDPSSSPLRRQAARSHRTPTVSTVQFIDGAIFATSTIILFLKDEASIITSLSVRVQRR